MCFSRVTKSLGGGDQDPLTLAGLGLAGILLPMALAKSIRKGASEEKLGFQNLTQLSVLKQRCDLELVGQGFSQERSLFPFPAVLEVLWIPSTLLIWYMFPGRGLGLCGSRDCCRIMQASHPKAFLWEVLFQKIQRSILSHVFQVQGGAEKWRITLFCWEITGRISEHGNRTVSSNLPTFLPYSRFPLLTKLVLIASQKGISWEEGNSWEAFSKVIQLLSKLWMMEKTVLDILSNVACSG